MVAEQPTIFDDDAQHDETVRFYAEWHGVRYSLGKCRQKPVEGTLVRHPSIDDMQMDSMPMGRIMIEVEFQPMLYRERGDPSDAPMREKLYLRSRSIPSTDYLILTDEKLKEIEEEQ